MPAWLQRQLPFLRWPRPTADTLRADLFAGITVGLVLIPQALAYATLAGMPPATGLYAALLPGIIGILFGSSPLLAVGPVALTSLLTFSALAPLAEPGGAEWVSLAIWLALYSGLIQWLLGICRMGVFANFISNAVITGFINAAAIIILCSQLPSLLGLPGPFDGHWLETAATHWQQAPGVWLTTAALGLGSIGMLVVLRRWVPAIPGVIVVCALGIALSAGLGFSGHVVGTIPAGLPGLTLPPALSPEQHRALLTPAIVIALVSFTEAMSSCRTLARNEKTPWDRNQELIGQGLAKMASGFSGAFPVSGSFSRSALNAYSGAKTAWSTLFAAACVALGLCFLTGLLADLPKAVLAAIIIVPVLNLIDLQGLHQIWRVSRKDGVVALVTAAVTLLTAPHLYWGIVAGFGLSILFFLYQHAMPRIVELGRHESGALRDRAVYGLPPIAPGTLMVRMDASLTFITAAPLERFIRQRIDRKPAVATVILSASSLNRIDSTGTDTLAQIAQLLSDRNIRLYVSGAKYQVRAAIQQAGLMALLGDGAFTATDQHAIDRAVSTSPA